MRNFLAIMCILFHVANGLAQDPKFTDYPARVIPTRRSVKLKLHSTPDTVCFRTMLRKTAREGQLFAGHYALGFWGCGTCIRMGIVDLLNGRSYVSPFEVSNPPPQGGVKVKPNSRLIIVDDPVRTDGSWYYYWNGRHLLDILGGGKISRRERQREFAPCSQITRF
jgi:hypothetical protein